MERKKKTLKNGNITFKCDKMETLLSNVIIQTRSAMGD